MKNHKSLIGIILLLSSLAVAGAIKTWANGETLKSADLNGNFQHIHNLMVGGHGARLVDADVSITAAVASSKLAAYRRIPTGWVSMAFSASGCGTAVAGCTVVTSSGMTITGTGAGLYTVTLGYTATDTSYGVILSLKGDGTVKVCDTVNYATTQFQVVCKTTAPAASDVGFTATVFDNN